MDSWSGYISPSVALGHVTLCVIIVFIGPWSALFSPSHHSHLSLCFYSCSSITLHWAQSTFISIFRQMKWLEDEGLQWDWKRRLTCFRIKRIFSSSGFCSLSVSVSLILCVAFTSFPISLSPIQSIHVEEEMNTCEPSFLWRAPLKLYKLITRFVSLLHSFAVEFMARIESLSVTT